MSKADFRKPHRNRGKQLKIGETVPLCFGEYGEDGVIVPVGERSSCMIVGFVGDELLIRITEDDIPQQFLPWHDPEGTLRIAPQGGWLLRLRESSF